MFKRLITVSAPVFLTILLVGVFVSSLSAQAWDLGLVTTVSSGEMWGVDHSGIVIDSNGSPHIFEYHPKVGTNKRLWYHYLQDGQWQHENLAQVGSGANSGPAVCMDSQGNIHVAYLTSNRYLGHAFYNGEWTFQVADQSVSNSSWMEMAIDSNDNLHVGYAASGHLKYAQKVGNDWFIETLSTSGGACVTSVVVDSLDHPHILSWGGVPNASHRYFDGTQWQQEVLPIGGVYSSLVLDSLDRPQISYYYSDNTQYSLWFMTKDTGEWVQTLVDYGTQQDKRGWYTHILYGPDGNLHIAYFNHNIGLIRHAWLDDFGWHLETIAEVGLWSPSIDFVSTQNKLFMTYHNINTGGFWLAEKLFALSSPENLTAQVQNVNDVFLSWNPPEPNSYMLLTGYRIYLDGSVLASIQTDFTDYLITGLANGPHSFHVTALYGQEESPNSNVTNVTIILLPPSNFTAQLYESDVYCFWQPPTQTTNITGFKVYRNGVEVVQTVDNTFTDYAVPVGTLVYWATAIYNLAHESVASNSAIISTVSNSDPELPYLSTKLYNNFPNPFNPSTVITYSLACDTEFRIEIYNLKGERIRTLVRGSGKAGMHSVHWDGRDDNNLSPASGVYVVCLKTKDSVSYRKLHLIK